MSNQVGISIYLQNGSHENKKIIEKAIAHKMQYIFSSLNIPEENGENFVTDVKELISLGQQYQINIIFDVNQQTLEKFNLNTYPELKQIGITHLRLDYGFETEEIVALSKEFHLVLNASTLTESFVLDLLEKGLCSEDIIACHNYYPKCYSGLSYQGVKEMNDLLHQYHFKTMGFVAGDLKKRGPFYEGLPTVEESRNMDFLLSVLKLHDDAACDIVMVGDVDIQIESWRKLKAFSEDCVELEVNLDESYHYLYGVSNHDRIDNSEYVIRSVESRGLLDEGHDIKGHNSINRHVGAICISNENYGRYQGELEIAKKELSADKRINVCGMVSKDHLEYLPYIRKGRGFILKKEEAKA